MVWYEYHESIPLREQETYIRILHECWKKCIKKSEKTVKLPEFSAHRAACRGSVGQVVHYNASGAAGN